MRVVLFLDGLISRRLRINFTFSFKIIWYSPPKITVAFCAAQIVSVHHKWYWRGLLAAFPLKIMLPKSPLTSGLIGLGVGTRFDVALRSHSRWCASDDAALQLRPHARGCRGYTTLFGSMIEELAGEVALVMPASRGGASRLLCKSASSRQF